MAIYKKALNGLKSDASLLRAFSNGDASAFDTLYNRYKDHLFNYLCNQLDQQPSAEEIAQEVWMAVIRGAEKFEDTSFGSRSFDNTSPFRSWLFAIAYRRSADYWRQKYKASEKIDQLETELSDIPDQLSPPQEQARFIQELQRGLYQLPDEQRQSFLLREEGFSYLEIAEITQSNTEAVKSRLRYARKSLQIILGSNDD